MQRNTASFTVANTEKFKQQMLEWANQFNICCFLDNNQYKSNHHSYEWLLAADAVSFFSPIENILCSLRDFCVVHNDWLFGHFNYDLKNETEQLTSSHSDHIQFPDIYLFQPKIVIRSAGNEIEILCLDVHPSSVYSAIKETTINKQQDKKILNIQPQINREEYLEIIKQLQHHILRGDCYEINFCMEFFAANAVIDPLNIYEQLTNISPNPFCAYYKLHDKYLLCASPERYLKKQGNDIISQPIKGTIRRNNTDPDKDDNNKKYLKQSAKDRSENIMIVDLMRNDLSKICKENSVRVEELFGIYTFPQVHQMISTIKGELKENIDLVDILKATFPMGSMTGAPKKRVMQLIEQYEQAKRGIFSGAVGYITPGKDFDFNVVIRSIMYNAARQHVSYQVGSGITFYSNPEEEYEECLLKAKAIEKVLK